MKITYEEDVDAAYISLVDIPPKGVARTRAIPEYDIMLDFDAHSRLVGIEVLSARSRLPKSVLDQAEPALMLPTSLKLGMTVIFSPKVFEPPYTPYYDAYKGHQFRVIAFHPLGHVEVECIDDPSVIVSGHVHDDELLEGRGSPPNESSHA